MFGNKIVKNMLIQGMTCEHCSKRIEEALKRVKEVKLVRVNLDTKTAEIILKNDVEDDVLKRVVEEIGFEVIKFC